MTVKEFSSRSNQFQIYFWDSMIWTMSTLQQVRYRYFNMFNNDRTQPKLLKILITGLVWLALGLYLGVLLGYLGI